MPVDIRRSANTLAIASAIAAAFAVSGPVTAAGTQLGRTDISLGYMVSTCGGMSNGNGTNVGDRAPVHPDPTLSNCQSAQATLKGGSVSSAATFDSVPYTTHAYAQGTVDWGSMKLYAEFSGPNSAPGPSARATGGWVDRLRIDAADPALTGTAGVMNFIIHVQGVLDVQPIFNAGAGVGLRSYVNDQITQGSGHRVAGQGQRNAPYHQEVDSFVPMIARFVFGTEFEFGLFAEAVTGTSSVAAVNLINVGLSDFGHTMTWEGITSVTRNGAPVDYRLYSAAGVDWTLPYVPGAVVAEPSSVALVALGLAGIAMVVRRRPA
ncbi:MAG: hypothetical protein ACKVQR_06330 [Aquabacterium sp.]